MVNTKCGNRYEICRFVVATCYISDGPLITTASSAPYPVVSVQPSRCCCKISLEIATVLVSGGLFRLQHLAHRTRPLKIPHVPFFARSRIGSPSTPHRLQLLSHRFHLQTSIFNFLALARGLSDLAAKHLHGNRDMQQRLHVLFVKS